MDRNEALSTQSDPSSVAMSRSRSTLSTPARCPFGTPNGSKKVPPPPTSPSIAVWPEESFNMYTLSTTSDHGRSRAMPQVPTHIAETPISVYDDPFDYVKTLEASNDNGSSLDPAASSPTFPTQQ